MSQQSSSRGAPSRSSGPLPDTIKCLSLSIPIPPPNPVLPVPLTPLILTAPMASHHRGADDDDDDDDDDTDFDEYNPHPYQGGYDIALTYGRPLPPSTATCYPIDIEFAHRPDPTPLPVLPPPAESRHLPEPEPEPYAPPPAYDYGGESGYRPVSHDWADLDVFGFWPFVGERWGRCADVEEVGYWSQWKRAGDYLFGYSEGFGERRIGVDSLGIPIYANKKGIGEAVSVQIQPARDLTVDRCESDSWFSSYDEKKDVSYGCAYNSYHYQEPLCVEENLNEPTLHQRLTYHEDYEVQEYPKLEWWFSSNEDKKYESYGYAYNNHHYEEPLRAEENLIEMTLHQRLTYHEVYEEQESPKLEWQSSYSDYGDESYSHVNRQYAYDRHGIEQPLCVELEPYKPTWSQNLNNQEYYGGNLSIETIYHSSMDNGVGCESYTYGVPNNANEWKHSEQPLSVQLEPFKSSWSQNPTFYEHSSMDNKVGYNNNTFEVPNNAYEWHYSEQPQLTQLEPFKPTWSQNPTFYEQYNSQSSWVDDSVKEYGAQFFSLFHEYSRYDD